MKTLATLSVSLLVASAALTAQAHSNDVRKRHSPAFGRALDSAIAKREPQGPGGQAFPTSIIGDTQTESSTSTSSEPTSTRTTEQPPTPPPSSTTTSSTQPPQPPPTDDNSSSTSSSSTPSSSSSSSSSSSRSTAPASSASTSRPVVQNSPTFASVRQTTTITTSRSTASNADQTDTPDKPGFTANKGAVAATVTVAVVVVLGALIFIAYWIKRKNNRGKMGEEDMWDEASMKDFSRPPVAGMPVTPPPVAMSLADEQTHTGLTRTRTQTQALPSELARQRSHHSSPGRSAENEMEPDEILAMPPVKNYERPRDSAYDIVPAAPPTSAYASHQGYGNQAYGGQGYDYNAYSNAYASASGSNAYAAASGSGSNGGLAPPKRAGDHTSFGSGFGNDPFAGTGFVDATRESAYGPGQAGRGAGYSGAGASASGSGSHAQVNGLGNQWPQNYDPYTGYSQGSQAPYGGQQAYGGGYGYAS